MIFDKFLPIFKGATASKNGARGAVPPALISERAKYLRGDGQWVTGAVGGDMVAANNLADVDDVADARDNLGLDVLATKIVNMVYGIDSNTSGNNGTATAAEAWPSKLRDLYEEFGAANHYNTAVGGRIVQDAIDGYTAEVHPYRPLVAGTKSLYLCMGGVNDVLAGTSAATIYANLKTLWALARADGFVVVAFTITHSASGNEAIRIAANKLIRSDKTLFDLLVEPELLPLESDLHFSPASHLLFAREVARVVSLKHIPYSTREFTINRGAIGATSTDGVVFENTNPAAAGAQQYSPRAKWIGQGWKTNATAASMEVDFVAELRPVQGAAAPTGKWVLSGQVAGGGYIDALIVDTSGNISTPGDFTLLSGGTFTGSRLTPASGVLTIEAAAASYVWLKTGALSLGTDTWAKASHAQGELLLDNGSTDSPGVHFYTADNENIALDKSGANLRFVKNLDEAGGAVLSQLSDAGAWRWNTYGAGTLTTDSSGNITATSDARAKNIQGPFSKGLDVIRRLTPHSYHWKPETGLNTADLNVSLIAQDLIAAGLDEAVATTRTVDEMEEVVQTVRSQRAERDGLGVLRAVPEVQEIKRLRPKCDHRGQRITRSIPATYTVNDRVIIAALVNAVKEIDARLSELTTTS